MTTKKYFNFCFFISIFLVHLVCSLLMHGPIIYNDELGYVGIARYIKTGDAYHLIGYYPLYGIIISPIMFFTKNLMLQYHLILVVNSILLTFSVFAIWKYIVNKSVIVSAFVATLPFALLMTNLIANENLYIFLFVLYVIFLYHESDSLKYYLLIFISISLFLTHPIGISVVIATFIYIIFSDRRKNIQKFAFLLFLLILVLVAYKINFFFISQRGILHGITSNLFIFNITRIKQFFITSLGQINYLLFSTYFILPFFYIAWQDAIKTKHKIIETFVLIIIFVINFSISVFYLSATIRGGDHFIYGRYNERILPVYLSIAAIYFLKSKKADLIKIFLFSLLFFLTSHFLFCWITPENKLYGGFNVVNILGYLPFIREFGNNFYTYLFFIPISLIVLSCIILLYNKQLLLIIFIGLSLISSSYSYKNYFFRDSLKRQEEKQIANVITKYFPDIRTICYDRRYWSGWHFANYRYWLPNKKIVKWPDPSFHDHCNLVISGLNFDNPNYALIALENHYNQYLFANNDLLKKRNLKKLIFHYHNGWRLTEYIYKLKILSISTNLIKIRIYNISNCPWPNRNGIKKIYGAVRVAYFFLDHSEVLLNRNLTRLDLKYSIYPGEHTDLLMRIPDNAIYLKIGLVQEGIRWFHNKMNQRFYKIHLTKTGTL